MVDQKANLFDPPEKNYLGVQGVVSAINDVFVSIILQLTHQTCFYARS